MLSRITKVTALITLLALTLPPDAAGRWSVDLDDDKNLNTSLSAQTTPAFCIVAHRVGKVSLSVNNNGTLGTGWPAGGGTQDCITNMVVPSCEYPINSNVEYLFAAAFWIGAVVGRDTLMSSGADGWSFNSNEFSPDWESLGGGIVYRSIRSPEDPEIFNGAISEEDYVAKYTDTANYVEGGWRGETHRPLNIEVSQRSYAWSYAYAEDFILFDYEIRNIGETPLENVYMGFYNDSDVGFEGIQDYHTDDICGFKESFTTNYDGCDFVDTVNIAWIADNDGDPDGAAYGETSCPAVTGMRIVRTPADVLDVSFNWWISNADTDLDFGPRERAGVGRWEEDFRDFGTGGMGTPEGDRNKYYSLRNMEFDFDQVYTAQISPADPIWVYPPQSTAADLSNGYDTRYLLSFGPFDIEPGEELPISFAFVAGENFHTNPMNLGNLPNDPDAFMSNIDFSDLSLNAAWAGRVYDNPGVDTDDDGKYGKVRVCCSGTTGYSIDSLKDTLTIPDFDGDICPYWYYEGDGVPDFRGASPPPPPVFWLEPRVGSIRVRFNGKNTETSRDVFSRLMDFEGYRIYVSRDAREGSFSMVASYDLEDYNRWVYNPDRHPDPGFELLDVPFTIDSLKTLYGEDFNPLDYPETSPFNWGDSLFYFVGQDYNCSELGVVTPIVKIYPDQPYPSSLNPDSVDASELTDDGYLKYFEYEFVMDNVLPTVEWLINVTAFDFGSPQSGLTSLESTRSGGAQAAYALSSAEAVEDDNLKVFVYPNPYRSDANYREDGFEGRLDADRPDDRVRALHFANLPAKCTIRIYTLDGDLVREIDHDRSPTDPEASHDTWNLITRNTQKAVSGIYYWTVESENGDTQVGKLVLIM
ncbi:MAG: hypothetical protein JSU74_06630 [Candidatus Zixiibacteriota bacterium]|nr:MAG: hypothetical protein JSU74_06630 [candidate division Zixibacteria bacterium]